MSKPSIRMDRRTQRSLVLSDYLDAAMAEALYQELGDGTVAAEIPPCVGVIAVAPTRADCAVELRSVLEGWVLLGLQLGHRLPVVGGIDLNPAREVASAQAD